MLFSFRFFGGNRKIPAEVSSEDNSKDELKFFGWLTFDDQIHPGYTGL